MERFQRRRGSRASSLVRVDSTHLFEKTNVTAEMNSQKDGVIIKKESNEFFVSIFVAGKDCQVI